MNTPTQSRGRGCLFYGCLTAVFLFVTIVLVIYFGARYAVNQMVNRFTDPQPITLPQAQMTDAEFQGLHERFKTFRTALDQQNASEPLVLTETELNALLAKSPELGAWRGVVSASLTNDQIQALVSIPVELMGLNRFKGRFLNGSARLKASLDNGVLIVTLQELAVKGNRVPDQVMTQLSRENLAKDLYKNAQTAEFLRRFESLEIKDGRIAVKPRARPTEPAPSPAPAPQ